MSDITEAKPNFVVDVLIRVSLRLNYIHYIFKNPVQTVELMIRNFLQFSLICI